MEEAKNLYNKGMELENQGKYRGSEMVRLL